MTYGVRVGPIIDAFAALITLPSDMVMDPQLGDPPPEYRRANVFYLWPVNQNQQPADTGQSEELFFHLRAAWARLGQAEVLGGQRLRSVADEIDAGVETVWDAVLANRANAVWEWIQVDNAQYDAVVTMDIRAAWIDISGYRFVSI